MPKQAPPRLPARCIAALSTHIAVSIADAAFQQLRRRRASAASPATLPRVALSGSNHCSHSKARASRCWVSSSTIWNFCATTSRREEGAAVGDVRSRHVWKMTVRRTGVGRPPMVASMLACDGWAWASSSSRDSFAFASRAHRATWGISCWFSAHFPAHRPPAQGPRGMRVCALERSSRSSPAAGCDTPTAHLVTSTGHRHRKTSLDRQVCPPHAASAADCGTRWLHSTLTALKIVRTKNQHARKPTVPVSVKKA